MESHRSWLSLLGYCVATVIGVASVFAMIVAGGSVALASHQGMSGDSSPDEAPAPGQITPPPQAGSTFTGMITDSHCGARHMRNSRQTAAECARACFRRGASYVLVDGDHRYSLVGEEPSLGKLAGERASITGTRQGNTILVDSAAAQQF